MHQKNTKEKILRVAAELFYEQGYEKTTLQAIASRVSVSHVNILRHYRDKVTLAGYVIKAFNKGLNLEAEKMLDVIPQDVDYFHRHMLWWTLTFRIFSENDYFRKFFISYNQNAPIILSEKTVNPVPVDYGFLRNAGRFSGIPDKEMIRSLFGALVVDICLFIDSGALDYIGAAAMMMLFIHTSEEAQAYDEMLITLRDIDRDYLPKRKIDLLNEFLLANLPEIGN